MCSVVREVWTATVAQGESKSARVSEIQKIPSFLAIKADDGRSAKPDDKRQSEPVRQAEHWR